MGSIYQNTPDFAADSSRRFERARMQIDSPFAYFDIDLSVGRTNVILPLAGDFLFADLSTNGIATIELNNQQDVAECPIEFCAGMAFNAPFKQLKISNSAQAGAKMRLLYSTGYSIVPSSSMSNINQILQPVNINDVVSPQCQNVYNNAAMPANGYTVLSLLAAGQNVNGVIVRSAQISVSASSTSSYAIAKLVASQNVPAPANGFNSMVNAIVMLTCQNANQSPGTSTMELLSSYRKIPAGWGIYAIQYNGNATLTAGFNADVSFEIL